MPRQGSAMLPMFVRRSAVFFVDTFSSKRCSGSVHKVLLSSTLFA